MYAMGVEDWKGKTVDQFRAWMEKFDNNQASVLEKKGEITITVADLQQKDPAKVKLVQDFVRAIDNRRSQSTGLIFQSVPQEITFLAGKDADGKPIPGQYSVEIQLVQGGKVTLNLSDPLGSGT
jgi:hypothetical protein